MYKIIGADGKEYGPISADQLRQWLAEGRANANTQVLAEGATEWQRLADVPEFADVAADVAAPPMPGLGGFAPMPAPNAGDQVNGPAIGLIVTAALGFCVQVLSLVMHLAGTSIMAAQQQMGNEALANMFSGTLGVVMAIVGMLVSLFILFGALKMRKLENYGLVMTASIIAMIPCISPCCLIGLPIGIWAVVILSKPEVKNAFH